MHVGHGQREAFLIANAAFGLHFVGGKFAGSEVLPKAEEMALQERVATEQLEHFERFLCFLRT